MKKGAAHLLAIILVLVAVAVVISARSFANLDPLGRGLEFLNGPATAPSSSPPTGDPFCDLNPSLCASPSPTVMPTIYPSVPPSPPPPQNPQIISFTINTRYNGLDQAGQTVQNGCLVSGPQKGKAAVMFSWQVQNAQGVKVSWTGNITGNFPPQGSTSTPFVISGWTPLSPYIATLHAYGGIQQEVTRTQAFTTNACTSTNASPTPSTTPTPSPSPQLIVQTTNVNLTPQSKLYPRAKGELKLTRTLDINKGTAKFELSGTLSGLAGWFKSYIIYLCSDSDCSKDRAVVTTRFFGTINIEGITINSDVKAKTVRVYQYMWGNQNNNCKYNDINSSACLAAPFSYPTILP